VNRYPLWTSFARSRQPEPLQGPYHLGLREIELLVGLPQANSLGLQLQDLLTPFLQG
jgi:hypothetical protein